MHEVSSQAQSRNKYRSKKLAKARSSIWSRRICFSRGIGLLLRDTDRSKRVSLRRSIGILRRLRFSFLGDFENVRVHNSHHFGKSFRKSLPCCDSDLPRSSFVISIIKQTVCPGLHQAALAHLGERQTEVHLSPALNMRFLEVLCSIHRSGIAFAFC
jgi:hypothetical protein